MKNNNINNKPALIQMIPNLITITRIILAPILAYSVFTMNQRLFLMIEILGLSTDALDGMMARILKATSSFGENLDTVADLLFGFVLFTGVYLFLREFIYDNFEWIILVVVIYLLSSLIGIINNHKIILKHFFSQKMSGFLSFVFINISLIWHFNSTLFHLLALSYILAGTEQFIGNWKTHIITKNTKSPLLAYIKARRKNMHKTKDSKN